MATAQDFLNLARSWIGKNEADGSFKSIIDIYNSHKPLARGYKMKYTDAWCATFISALAVKLNATDIVPTECGCQRQIELFKKLGVWVENESRTPSPGDIIYYDWDDSGKGDAKGWADHVGIVENVEGCTITTIEGNYSNRVKRRTIKVNARYIRGYAIPKYEASTNPTKSEYEVAKEVIAGKWGNGEDRKNLLESAGYDYEYVQDIVNDMLNVKNDGDKSNREIAKEVIKGLWGNGAQRKRLLTEAGYDYYAVQQIVNDIIYG